MGYNTRKAMNEIVYLSTEISPAVPVSSVRIEDGVPVHRYKKEVIRTGAFYKESDSLKFTVTPETLDHWVKVFQEWITNGNKVPIPEGHSAESDPSKNRGWVLDLFREADSLFAIMDLYGEDAPRIAATSDVSICSLPEAVDGKGAKYNRPITHIALCTDPVIPGLSKFEAIVASRKETSMNIKKLAKMLGLSLSEDEKDEEVEEKVEAAIKKLSADQKAYLEMKAKEDEDKKKKASQEDDEDVDDDDEKTIAASHMVIKLSAENRQIKLDKLLESNKITPEVHDMLSKKYTDEQGLRLSFQKGGDDFDDVFTMFAKNDPVQLGEKSGPQPIVLADLLKGKKGNPLLDDAESRSKKAQ